LAQSFAPAKLALGHAMARARCAPPRPGVSSYAQGWLLVALVALHRSCCAAELENAPMLGAPGLQPRSAGTASEQEPVMTSAGQPKDRMTELLHWAVENSDPAKLAALMEKYKEGNLTIKDVYGEDVINALFVDEASVMTQQISQIAAFHNDSISDGDLDIALEQLQELVEQVDNAANLHRMGGLQPLLDLAVGTSRSMATRKLALWTLGVAVQNNPAVQDDLVGLGGLHRLAAQLPKCGSFSGRQGGPSPPNHEVEASTVSEDPAEQSQYCGKLLFAVSGLVKNNATVQATADSLGVFDWLLQVGIRQESAAIKKKSLGILDTVLAQNPDTPVLEKVPAHQEEIAASLLLLIHDGKSSDVDADMIEKALRLVNRLLSLRPWLFGAGFKDQLAMAATRASQRCELAFGSGEDICSGLSDLASQAEQVLAARAVADEDL